MEVPAGAKRAGVCIFGRASMEMPWLAKLGRERGSAVAGEAPGSPKRAVVRIFGRESMEMPWLAKLGYSQPFRNRAERVAVPRFAEAGRGPYFREREPVI